MALSVPPVHFALSMGLLYAAVVRQAALLAFLDNFRLITLAALVCLPLLLLFRRTRARPAAGAH